jgi:nucleoside-diphosphate-sugar epimerase
MIEDKPTLLIFGASNQIGFFLLKRLVAEQGFKLIAISRQPQSPHMAIEWRQGNLKHDDFSNILADVIIYAAPLPLLPALLQNAPTGVKRLIAFGTTSRYTKTDSRDATERQLAQTYIDAENAVIQQCQRQHIAWTLLRPTLVYGCGQDKNIRFIARFIQRFGFFPLLGQANGLRQPVHADDLALACLQVIDCQLSFNRAYNLSGGSSLTYQQMVEHIFHALNKPVRLCKLPAFSLAVAVKVLAILPQFRHLSMSMFERMNQDLFFDHQAAQRDFGFKPRPFQPDRDALN